MITAVGLRAATVSILLSVTIEHRVAVDDADLVPGSLITVWWDETCACQKIMVETVETEPLVPSLADGN